MKKHFYSLLFVFLPMMVVGQTKQGVVIAEADFTTATEFTGWSFFANEQTDGKVELQAGEGLEITVGVQTGQYWQPQIMVIPDGSFDLEEDGNYKVILTAKFPTAGILQINMGSWSANDEATFPVKASDDFQTIECDFDGWSVTAEDAHLLFQCGDFKGTTILKKIQVIDMDDTPGSDIAYNYISKGKIAEVINKNYKGEVVIPSTVTHEGVEYTVAKIADNAFSNCTKLVSVTIPNSITSIGNSAFSNCSGLTSITIPNSVTSIGNYAFSSSALTSITIPNSVTSIGSSAFYGCSGLTSVTIPNSVTTISSNTFQNCIKLTSVTIPNNVTIIDWFAFYGCSGLTSVTIPNSVTTIGNSAFYGCSKLTSVTIPNNVTSIGSSAFSGCSGLTSVTIPNSVATIGSSVFSSCSKLASVTIPDNVTSIESSAFYGCSKMTSVTIGEKVNSISSTSFANCPDLADVYCLAGNVPSTSSDAFDGSYIDYATLHVPAASLNSYSNAVPWKNFKEIVVIGSSEIPQTQKCAKPTITFKDGNLTFSCATEGVEFVSEITAPAMTKKYDNEISLSSTYTVTVYATKAGYINSDKASIEIEANSGIKGDINGDGEVNVADHVTLTEIIMNNP